MDQEIVFKIKTKIKENRGSRENQIKFFVPLAKDVIEFVMTSEDTDEDDITQFFRIFNVVGNYELIRKSLKKLKAPENKKNELLKSIDLIEKNKSSGFTKSSRYTIPGFTKLDLIKIKSIFSQIIKLSEEYENLVTFSELVKELYDIHSLKKELSVWLNYIKPKIFPIISGTGKDLFEYMGYDCSWNSYNKLILEVPKITEVLDEKDFGIIDCAGWNINENEPINLKPKNIILYGPPGTGKTYKTKEKAVRIIGDNLYG